MGSIGVSTEVLEGGVALLTLNNPERRNAVDLAIRDELIAAFDRLEQSGEVGAVVITGAGSAFCAGADLASLASADADGFAHLYDAFLCVARSPLPSVAAVNGPAVGAGLNLALVCDARVAAVDARFIAGFLRLGLHPGGGSTWMLQRLVGDAVAARMVIFGEEIGGAEAARVGLAARCVETATVVEEAVALAAGAAAVPAELLSRFKQTYAALRGVDGLEAAVALELEAQAWSSRQDFFRERIARRRPAAADEPEAWAESR